MSSEYLFVLNRENQEKMEVPEKLVHQDQEVIPEKMDLKVLSVLLVQREEQENEVLLDLLVREDSKGYLAHLETLALQEKMEKLVCKDPEVFLEQQG